MAHRCRLLALVAAFALLLTACGRSSGSDATTSTARGSSAAQPPLSGKITVSAAASLTGAFTEIGKDFEAEHPGTKVRFAFDSSGTLSRQILAGAPADVFASADRKNIDEVADADLTIGDPVAFARNRLVIITKPGNPAGIKTLSDLAGVDGVVSLCGIDVPCGSFAAKALDKAGVTLDEGSVTRGQNAKATLAAVSEGDAVAGIVYVTDALAAGDAVTAVDIADADNVIATYPIVVLSGTEHRDLATAFAEFVASDAGQAVLQEQGFLPPS